MSIEKEYQEKLQQATIGCATNFPVNSTYKEPSLLEQVEMEREQLIARLQTLTQKIVMLKTDPSLAEKIQLFNRY